MTFLSRRIRDYASSRNRCLAPRSTNNGTKSRIGTSSSEPPSTYYKGRIFGCFTNDVHGMASIDAVGEDNVCFETDYPHTDTTWPNSKEYVEKMLADFDDNLAYKVLRGNAIRMLELDRT